ncbi:MAG: sigma-70 family RNA polymerase sigma factor [Planctomycetaceae bacterium]|nr:sigma-70 family RNA polymerase sigma factor [Planctomycetaceae bacterium]
MTETGPQLKTAASGNQQAPTEEFIRSFTQVQRSLYLYILPLVPAAADAEEVLQETNVVMLSKWTQFEPGTNFLAWSRAIARLEVFRFRRSRHHRVFLLGDDVISLLATRLEEQSDDLELRRDALSHCISQLRTQDQEIIRRRYAAGATGDDVANQLGRPANSVYQSVGRIRRVLLECVRRKMAAGGVQ